MIITFPNCPPQFWKEHGVSEVALYPFLALHYEDIKGNNTEIHFLGYYKFRVPQENYYYCREHAGFTPNTERSEGAYSKYARLDDLIGGFHYHLAHIKFGLGLTTSDTAHEIRDSQITREEVISLIKRYDHEMPKKYHKKFLEFCSITDGQVHEVIDSWRSDHIWKKQEEWKLRKPIWEEHSGK